MKIAIFTDRKQHVEPMVNYLNQLDLDYIISSYKFSPESFDFDVGVSYCWTWLIDLDKHPGVTWYNYHPAPLKWLAEGFPGQNSYAKGVHWMKKTGIKEWGVTLHLIDNGVDTGPILKQRFFNLDSIPCDVQELGDISHYHLFQLFKDTILYLQYKPKTREELNRWMGVPEDK